jgi:hypothetical protein
LNLGRHPPHCPVQTGDPRTDLANTPTGSITRNCPGAAAGDPHGRAKLG